VIETQRGPVFVATAPYPIRQRLGMNDGTQGKTIAELDLQLANQLNITLETLAEEAEKHDMPRLLTGHFTISGAIFGSERQIMLGRDVEAQRSVVADARWDYVAMGHIHRHQTVSADLPGAPPVVYSGSIERIDFGEERDTKGFCSVQLVRGATTWEFVPLTQCRPFASLKLDLRESADPTADVIREIEARNLKEAVVRVLVDLTPETEGRFSEDKIREALRRAGTWVIASISRHVERPARVRLGSSSEALSDIELLERYLINREVPPARRAALLELADPILNATTDDTGE
jgi:exonuclease SbcD